jgi:hypothetical protein
MAESLPAMRVVDERKLRELLPMCGEDNPLMRQSGKSHFRPTRDTARYDTRD